MQDQDQIITDETSERKYFTMIANFIDDLPLSPLAIALYFHYKRWAFITDRRPPGVRFLMRKFQASDRSIRKAKDELVREGLVRIEPCNLAENTAERVVLLDASGRNEQRRQKECQYKH